MQESKDFCTNYLTKFSIDLNGICSTVETCWYDEPHTILAQLFTVQGRKPYICDCAQKKTPKKPQPRTWTLACIQKFWTDSFFKLSMMIQVTKFYILISVWMTLTFIQGCGCMRNEKLVPFSHKFKYQCGWDSVWCHNLLICWSSC